MNTEKPATTWAVAAGEYSDYRVLCVCSTKKIAQTIVARIKRTPDTWHSGARVEEMYVATDDTRPEAVLNLTVTLWDDGVEDAYTERVTHRWPWDYGYAPGVEWRWVRAPMHNNKGGRLEVSGTDHERVRRVFSDRKAQIKAEDALRLKREARGQR